MQKIDMKIYDGEFVLVGGVSGSGKTTLLNSLKEKYGNKAMIVPQNPSEGIVTSKVYQEIAFGLESLGYSQDYMSRKVAEMTSFFGLNDVYMKKTTELSGGLKQLVLLASVMATEPEILLLDEPTSELDPLSADRFLSSLEKIHREIGTTIVMAEHRFSGTLHLADRMVVVDEMKIVSDGEPEEVIADMFRSGNALFKSMPVYVKMFFEAGCSGHMPVDVNSGRKIFEANTEKCEGWIKANYGAEWLLSSGEIKGSFRQVSGEDTKSEQTKSSEEYLRKGEKALDLKRVSFGYDKKDVLKELTLAVPKGSICALLGGNGSGKSTLLSLISGRERGFTGKIKSSSDKVVMLPQNPRLMFFKESIEEDLESYRKSVGGCSRDEALAIVKRCHVEHLLSRHPYDVSGGEIQRAALAKALISGAEIILMDEPTKGTEGQFKEEISEILRGLVKEGKTIVIACHDLEFAALYADYCGMLFNCDVTKLLPTSEFFSGNTFYTSDVLRVQRCCEDKRRADKGKKREIKPVKSLTEKEAERSKWLYLIPLFSIFVLMPLTIYVGSAYLENRKYFFISLLVLLELFVPMYLLFEAGKPKAIKMVVIATMSALTVIGRGIFYMLPSIKPVIAIVMMAGFAFGPMAGFAVGSTAMLVSNAFFGQGPWTPYQMFTFGLIGLLAGVIGKDKRLIKSKPFLAVAGVLMTYIVFGGIMNPAGVIMYYSNPTREMIATAYASGFPMDTVTALFTAIILVLGTAPVLRRCERVKRYL